MPSKPDLPAAVSAQYKKVVWVMRCILAATACLTPGLCTGAAEEPAPQLPDDAIDVRSFVQSDTLRNLSFSADGKFLLTVNKRAACTWNLATGKRTWQFRPAGYIHSSAITADRKHLLLAHARTGLTRTDFHGQDPSIVPLYAQADPRRLTLSRDQRYTAYADKAEVVVHDLAADLELRRIKAHDEYTNAIAFSPDGKRLAFTSNKCPIHVVEIAQRSAPPLVLDGTAGFSAFLAFSPDGKTIAGSCEIRKGKVSHASFRTWDSQSGKVIHNVPGSFRAGAYSPDGSKLAIVGSQEVAVYDAHRASKLHQLPESNDRTFCVAWSPDGHRLAVGYWYHARLWNTGDWSEMHPAKNHTGRINALAFSPDGKTLASGGLENDLAIWNWPAGTLRHRITGIGTHWGVNNLTFSPDGSRLAVTAWANKGDMFLLYDPATGERTGQFGDGSYGRSPIAFHPARNELYTDNHDGGITAWDGETFEALRKLGKLGSGRINDIHPVPGTDQAWITGQYNALQLWSLDTGMPARELSSRHSLAHQQLAVAPGLRYLATGGTVWESATGNILINGRDGANVFSPCGQLLAHAIGTEIKISEALTRKCIHTFTASPAAFKGLAFTPDGTMLAAATANGIQLWDMTGMLENRRLPQRELEVAAMATHWDALGSTNGWAAQQASWALAAAGDSAVKFIAGYVVPARELEPDALAALRNKLSDPDYDLRERSARELLMAGAPLSEDDYQALRRPNTRGQLGRTPFLLLNAANPPPEPGPVPLLPVPELLPLESYVQQVRAITSLERNRSPAAVALLEKIATGFARAPLTREAKDALGRLAQKR